MFKKIATTLFIGFMAFASVITTPTICAHAEDPFASDNAAVKIRLEEIANSLDANDREDSAKKLRMLVEKLDAADDDDDKLQDIDGVRSIMESVLSDKEMLEIMGWRDAYDYSAAMFEVNWLNAFGEAVAPYGISVNKFEGKVRDGAYGVETDVTDTGKSQDKLTDKTDDSAKMVQKLRWSKNDNDSKVNVTSVLKMFETNFSGIMLLMQSISAALVVAFGASNLLRMSSDRMVSYDSILREFLKLIFGVWFIFNYRYFAILVLRIGTYFTEAFLDGVGNMNSTSQTAAIMRNGLWTSLDSLMQSNKVDVYFKGLASAATGVYQIATEEADPWYTKIGTAICSAFGGVAGFTVGSSLINLAINWVVFAILIELGIRYTFTPIAIADLYSEGFHSNGMRWLKKMLACALTGALIYLTMYGANVIKTQLTGFHPVQLTAINLTMTGFFVKTRQIADEIVGVR